MPPSNQSISQSVSQSVEKTSIICFLRPQQLITYQFPTRIIASEKYNRVRIHDPDTH